MHPNMISQQFHLRRTTLSLITLITLILMVLILIPQAAFSAPLLHCKIEQSGATFLVETSPRLDPYGFASVAINKSFRFKAVMIGDEKKIDYIKIYTYYQGDRQAILLHEVKYLAPVAQSAALPPYQLTGTNYLYSPNLNRELQYGCSLIDNVTSTAK